MEVSLCLTHPQQHRGSMPLTVGFSGRLSRAGLLSPSLNGRPDGAGVEVLEGFHPSSLCDTPNTRGRRRGPCPELEHGLSDYLF